MDAPQITPSRWFYVLAGLVLVVGMGLFAGILFKVLYGIGDKLQQVVAPGETDISLREAGHYTISYEYHSVIGNKVYSTDENISGLECALVAKTNGAKIALSPSSMNSTYEIEGRSGRGIFEFNIDRPGIYQLSAKYPKGQQGPEIVLAVGQDFITGLVVTIFGAIAVFLGSIGIALAILLVTLIKRSNKKKLLASQALLQAAKRSQFPRIEG